MILVTALRSLWFPSSSFLPTALIAFAFPIVTLGAARADLIVYRNFDQFANAISTSGRTTNTVNFDSTPLGTTLTNSTFQGLVFGANMNVTGNLRVTDGAPTITGGLRAFSGSNFLGSDSGELISVGSNQSFSFSFQPNVSGVGFYFLSESQLGSSELGFRIGATSAFIDTQNGNEIPLTGGTATPSFAYFVGIVDTNPLGILSPVTVFGSLTSASFGIDNIVTAVPEPSSIIVVGFALGLGVVCRVMRKKSRKATRKVQTEMFDDGLKKQ